MKEFLHEHHVPFEEKDVSADDAALEELTALGFSATPVTVIDGEAVVGFNRPRLRALLGLDPLGSGGETGTSGGAPAFG